eukprot:m.435630 g.435630  ORF g.435630 m.435630 type:complete len:122 (+) comp20260_c0_seq8:1394-1759(+)
MLICVAGKAKGLISLLNLSVFETDAEEELAILKAQMEKLRPSALARETSKLRRDIVECQARLRKKGEDLVSDLADENAHLSSFIDKLITQLLELDIESRAKAGAVDSPTSPLRPAPVSSWQ